MKTYEGHLKTSRKLPNPYNFRF